MLPATSWIVKAESYPSRPITIVVPFPAGGPSDATGRIVAERMGETLGQPIIIENVGGAAGSIGAGRVARAPADGHTLVLGYWGTHVANAAIYSLQYDVVKDFEPVARLPGQPMMIFAKKTMPANDLRELIGWLKVNPDRANQGTGGVGGIAHIAGHFFQKQTGTRYRFVHYRGTALVMNDLVSGHIDLGFSVPASAVPQAQAGVIKAYAVMANSRLPMAPEIPTVDEAGVPGLYLSVWQGLWAPKGTPTNAIAKLSEAVARALADPTVRKRFTDQGFDIPPLEQQSPAALRAHQNAEIEKWWPIIKAANIKAD
jgi:tripartite-type tricarboxylate transporter receptor subunit TctC